MLRVITKKKEKALCSFKCDGEKVSVVDKVKVSRQCKQSLSHHKGSKFFRFSKALFVVDSRGGKRSIAFESHPECLIRPFWVYNLIGLNTDVISSCIDKAFKGPCAKIKENFYDAKSDRCNVNCSGKNTAMFEGKSFSDPVVKNIIPESLVNNNTICGMISKDTVLFGNVDELYLANQYTSQSCVFNKKSLECECENYAPWRNKKPLQKCFAKALEGVCKGMNKKRRPRSLFFV